MHTKPDLIPFDMAAHLDSEAAIAEYLNIVLEENDSAAFVQALATAERARGLNKATAPTIDSAALEAVLRTLRNLGIQLKTAPA